MEHSPRGHLKLPGSRMSWLLENIAGELFVAIPAQCKFGKFPR
jgi:hypothetical protein